MTEKTDRELLEELLVEVTANRLIVRNLLAYLVFNSKKPLRDIMADFDHALSMTDPQVLAVDGVGADLQKKVNDLLARRLQHLISDLGRMLPAAGVERGLDSSNARSAA